MDALYDVGGTVGSFLIDYGWYLFVLIVLYGAFRHKIEAAYDSWRRRRDQFAYAAKYHKDSDLARSRQESLLAAREKLQREHDVKAAVAEEKRKEREAKKAAEKLEANQSKTGSSFRSEYLPLSGGGSSSNYKPPKRSGCKKGGGCG